MRKEDKKGNVLVRVLAKMAEHSLTSDISIPCQVFIHQPKVPANFDERVKKIGGKK